MFQEEGTARTKLLSHLGFTIPHESINSTSDNLGMKLENPLNLGNGSFVEGEADNGEEFFNNTQVSEDSLANPDNTTPIPEEAHREHEEPTGTYDPSFDESVQRALVVGDYKGAISQCITANRMADALVIAHAGGPSLWESTRDQYLKNSLVSYLKVVSAVASNDLTALVNNRPLNSWKETLALLCTYAKGEEWTILCEILASRLMTIGNTLAATLCYICAGSIDKIVEIWSRHLKPDCEGRTFVDLLQDLIEKTIILTLVTGHKRFSASLSKLVENYAELLANQGLLSTAMEYLKLLGSEEPSNELARLRDRIAFCSAESEVPKSVSYESSTASQARTVYGADHTSFGTVNSLQSYYQVTDETQLNCIPSTSHLNGFHQSSGSAYGGYQQVQPKSQFPHTNALLQPAQTFIPSQTSQVPQQNFASAVVVRPTLKALVPATTPALRNVENYQRTLGSQLYPGNAPVYQPGHQTSVQGIGVSQQAVGHRFVQPVTGTSAPPSFVPISTLNFAQRPILGHVQPLSPTKPQVQTVDTSNVR